MIAPLITPEYMYIWTTIDKNIDPTIINANIMIAQDVHIQSILGENLYQKIMGDVISGFINNPTDSAYQNLLNNYIQIALAHFTHYEMMMDVRTRETNKGVLEKTTPSNISNPASDSEFNNKVNHIFTRANFYNQRIREQIINNTNLYPEYFSQIGIERIVPKRTTYFSGVAYRSTPLRGYDRNKCCGGPTGYNVNV